MSDSSTLSAADVILGMAVAALLFLLTARIVRRSEERDVYLLALVVKFAASIAYAFYIIAIFKGGDSLLYHALGTYVGDQIRSDVFSGSFSSLIAALVLVPGHPATANFVLLVSLLHAIFYDSFLASSFVLAMAGYLAQVLIYRAFVLLYPDPRLRMWWRMGILFFPSLTFWSSGLLKDPLGMLGIGLIVWGMAHLLFRLRIWHLLVVLVGIYVLLLFRAQVLMPLAAGLLPLAVIGSPRAQARVRRPGQRRPLPWRLGLIALAPLLLLLVGHFNSKYSLANLPNELSYKNDVYATQGAQGGSLTNTASQISYDATWSGLIKAAPQAVLYTLARPFPWEASGMVAIVAALENLVVDILILRVLGYAIVHPEVLKRAIRSPFFLTCVIFVGLFAVGVGIATPNIGTLSRYRIPLLPFLIGGLTILHFCELQAREAAKETRRRRPIAMRASSRAEG